MPSKLTAAITAVGAWVPDYTLTNAELEKMVETNDEWIKTRTGVEERRILKGENKGTSDLGAPLYWTFARKEASTLRDRLFDLLHGNARHVFSRHSEYYLRQDWRKECIWI
jgi:hypothetical protein